MPLTVPHPGLKRGVPIGYYRDPILHLKLHDPTTVVWWYNWNNNVSTKYAANWTGPQNKAQQKRALLSERLPSYVPMIKERKSVEREELDKLYVGSRYLMGFNEPYGPVINISAEDVAGFWPIIEGERARLSEATGQRVEIVSPTVCPKDEGFDWVDGFLPLMSKHNIDFDHLSVHYYKCDASRVKFELDSLYVKFGKPIWLTEFNCGDGFYNMSEPHHYDYMTQALPMLERHPYVTRYAWMSSTAPVKGASLVDETAKDGRGKLTRIGEYYNEFPNHTSFYRSFWE
jgi:hypothetical protein